MNQQRTCILICDSDAETLISLEQLLEDAGFDTTTTWDASGVTRLLQAERFGLVLIGNHPPQMDAEIILRDPQVSGIPCLVLDSDLSNCNLDRLHSLGAIAVVPRRSHAFILKQIHECLDALERNFRKSG